MTDASTPSNGPGAASPPLRAGGFGGQVMSFEEVASTIDQARDWLRRGGPHGGVVIAGRQTQGRGRLGRCWASPHGGLWMSILTRPDMPADRAGRLGTALALAAAEAVWAEVGVEAKVKWPNDVLLAGRKVGGILVDARVDQGRVVEAVLSLGLNASFPAAELPESVRATATTLLDHTGRRCDPRALAARVLGALEALWPEVTGAGAKLVELWRRRDALVGREVSVGVAGKVLEGVAQGIDDRGALLLVSAGRTRAVASGEVASVREALYESPQVRAR